MKCIRGKYGEENKIANRGTIDEVIDGLLMLIYEGLTKHFALDNQAAIVNLNNYLSDRELQEGDVLFVGWFERKGLPIIKKIINTELPDDEQLIARLEYESYILEQEIKHYEEYPQDLRSCLIDIILEMSEMLAELNQMEISITEYCVSITYDVKQENKGFIPKVGGVGLEPNSFLFI